MLCLQGTSLFTGSEMTLILFPPSSLPLTWNSLIFPAPEEPGWCRVYMIPKSWNWAIALTLGMGTAQGLNGVHHPRQTAVFSLATRWRRKEEMGGKDLKTNFSSGVHFSLAHKGTDQPNGHLFFCSKSDIAQISLSNITRMPYTYLQLIIIN